jgi:hypothetical protein
MQKKSAPKRKIRSLRLPFLLSAFGFATAVGVAYS